MPCFRKDDRAFFFIFLRLAQTLILVGETLPWYHSDLLGLPILGGHPGIITLPYGPRRDDDGLFFLPLSNPNQSLISKKKHLLTILNTTHYEQNLRKNLWATGSLS